jgi:hypothetical protein
MTRTLFQRQLRVALVPTVLFIACAAVTMIYRGAPDGSAGRGYVRDGKYMLSLGHGGYQETSKERFETIRHREHIALLAFAGMALSGLSCGFLIMRARVKPDLPSPQVLHPTIGRKSQ